MSWILQRMLLFYYFSVWGKKKKPHRFHFRGCYHQGGWLSSSGFIKKGGTLWFFFFFLSSATQNTHMLIYIIRLQKVLRNCVITVITVEWPFYLLCNSRLREATVTDLPQMTNNLTLLTIWGHEAFLAFSSSPASTSLIMHVRQWVSKGLLLQPLQPPALYTFTLLSFFIWFYSLCVGIIKSLAPTVPLACFSSLAFLWIWQLKNPKLKSFSR